MQTTQRKVVVGVFEDRRRAQQAVDELKRNGFTDAQIGVVSRDEEGYSSTTSAEERGSNAAAGAATGAAAGAGVGALWALGIAAGVLPAIGPVIAGGLLASVLASAAGGAAVAGIVGALIGLGIPQDEAEYYEGEVKGGRTLVTVKADNRYNEALVIIQRHGGYDRSTQRASTSTSTTPVPPAAFCPTGTSQSATTSQSARTASGAGQTMQLHEEKLNVHKQPVETGEVRVRKEVVTEHKTIDVPVQREEVVIERHAVCSQPASSADIRSGDEIRIPVKEEQVRVDKQAVVTEEVKVGKRQVQDTEHVSGTVRKEKVHVEHEGDVNVKGSNAGDTKSRGKR